MIAVKEKISIEEFDGKNYQIKLVEPYDKALITHYLHNYRNGVSKHYKKDAVKILNNFVEYKQVEEQINIVAEDALQQLLLKLKTFRFQLHKIILSNLLTFLQELEVFV